MYGGGYTEGSGQGQPGDGNAARAEQSAGDACSFAGISGETANRSCVMIQNRLVCVSVGIGGMGGGMGGYRTGRPESQPEGAR